MRFKRYIPLLTIGLISLLVLIGSVLLCTGNDTNPTVCDDSIQVNGLEYVPVISWLNRQGYVISQKETTKGRFPNGQVFLEYKYHFQQGAANVVLTFAVCDESVISVMMGAGNNQLILSSSYKDYVVHHKNIYIASTSC